MFLPTAITTGVGVAKLSSKLDTDSEAHPLQLEKWSRSCARSIIVIGKSWQIDYGKLACLAIPNHSTHAGRRCFATSVAHCSMLPSTRPLLCLPHGGQGLRSAAQQVPGRIRDFLSIIGLLVAASPGVCALPYFSQGQAGLETCGGNLVSR